MSTQAALLACHFPAYCLGTRAWLQGLSVKPFSLSERCKKDPTSATQARFHSSEPIYAVACLSVALITTNQHLPAMPELLMTFPAAAMLPPGPGDPTHLRLLGQTLPPISRFLCLDLEVLWSSGEQEHCPAPTHPPITAQQEAASEEDWEDGALLICAVVGGRCRNQQSRCICGRHENEEFSLDPGKH